ncbi:transposase [Peribacillus simplex]|nr:transposase [Peribacillus simplex]
MTKRKRRTFTSEFKQQIIEHYQSGTKINTLYQQCVASWSFHGAPNTTKQMPF